MLSEQTAFGQSLAYQPVAQDSLAYGSALPAYEQRQLPDYYSAALAQRAAGTAGTAGNGRATQPSPAGEAVVPVAHFAGGPLYVAQGDWLAAAQPPAMVVNGHALAQAEGLHEATLPDLLAAGALAGNWAPVQADPQPDHGCQTGGPCACGGACGGKCGGKCGSKGATSAGGCGCGKQGDAAHGVSAGNPWPLDDPRHNLVLLAQELLLLEGHLADPERRCPSCVTKHALTVRGLADEGRRLDLSGKYTRVWRIALRFGVPHVAAAWPHIMAAWLLGMAVGQLFGCRELDKRPMHGHGRASLTPRDPGGGECSLEEILAAVLIFVLHLLLGASYEEADQAFSDFLGGCTGGVDLPNWVGGGAGEGARSNRQYTPKLQPGYYEGSACPPKVTFSKDVCQVAGGPGVGGNFCFLNCKDLSGQKGKPAYELAWDGEGIPVDLKCEACQQANKP